MIPQNSAFFSTMKRDASTVLELGQMGDWKSRQLGRPGHKETQAKILQYSINGVADLWSKLAAWGASPLADLLFLNGLLQDRHFFIN